MDDILAIITLDRKRRKNKIAVIQKQFKFKCLKCADLCCKLGGPELTAEDIERIEDAGYNTKDFFDPKTCNNNSLKTIGSLKKKQDGSCIFLEYKDAVNYSPCIIYEFRPTLCRIYPFRIESLDDNKIAFKFIPCCKGLQNNEGRILDKEFFRENIEEAIRIYKIKKIKK